MKNIDGEYSKGHATLMALLSCLARPTSRLRGPVNIHIVFVNVVVCGGPTEVVKEVVTTVSVFVPVSVAKRVDTGSDRQDMAGLYFLPSTLL